MTEKRRRHGLGYFKDAHVVTFRVAKDQWDELVAEGMPEKLSGHEVARRRAFPGGPQMIAVLQYLPKFAEAKDSVTAEAGSLDDLLQVDWIKAFADADGFYRWSTHDNHLIAEYDRGDRHWVVAKIMQGKVAGLPAWNAQKGKRRST